MNLADLYQSGCGSAPDCPDGLISDDERPALPRRAGFDLAANYFSDLSRRPFSLSFTDAHDRR